MESREFSFDDFESPTSRVLTVTELTRSIRSVLESAIGDLTVEGEIGSYRRHASGHQYFTLKDAQCQVSCVLFRRPYQRPLKQVPLEDGMQVQVRGTLTVYEARGQYQINVSSVQLAGAGLLQAKFEALKRKLADEGLFAADRKRSLPRFPRLVGIITSPTGAAIRDILTVLERRAPWIQILIYPVRVQGEGSALEIMEALRYFNSTVPTGHHVPDVIIVTRGGGSMEDLWEFNDEMLAHTIAESHIPVVSAVGHEIDFTISDFVADLRAPTPSAAAEIIAPDGSELLRRIGQMEAQIRRIASTCLEQWRSRVGFVARSGLFREPSRILAEYSQRLDGLSEALESVPPERIRESRHRVERLLAVVRQHRPDQLLKLRRQELSARIARIEQRVLEQLTFKWMKLKRLEGLLKVLSPIATMERGFSMTTTAGGLLIRSVSDATPGMKITTRLVDGAIDSEVVQSGNGSDQERFP
jgi:exodeoxyribonuclease VII large subunit